MSVSSLHPHGVRQPRGTLEPPTRHQSVAAADPVLSVPRPAEGEQVLGLERWLAHRVLQALGSPPAHLVLWTGEVIGESDSAPVARIVFHDRPTFWKLLFDPDLQFGDAYSDRRLEVEGDLVALLETVSHARLAPKRSGGLLPAALYRHLHPARVNSLGGARENIHEHYDIGNDFYNLWLDEEMVYSGAYFPDPAMTLEEAQRAKLDYVCRKLWLKRGEIVVEVGGGWGGLALWMARHFGVIVKSFNISKSQLLYARRRAKAEGLHHQVEFIEDDYRNITGHFDALVSLGMLEHVGARYYREFSRVMDRCLTPTGRGLIQVIGQDWPARINPWIERRIFPGAVSAHLAAVDRPVRTVGLLRPRRREPAAALRQDPWALAATLRGLVGNGGPHVRRPIRADVAAVPGRFVRRLCRRRAATVPSGVRPARRK